MWQAFTPDEVKMQELYTLAAIWGWRKQVILNVLTGMWGLYIC